MRARTAVRVVVACMLVSSAPASARPWQFPAGEEPVREPLDVVFTLTPVEGDAEKARAQIALCMQDERNYYFADFRAGKAFLGLCSDGQRFPLTPEATLPPGPHEIAIQRRAWLLRLVCDGRPMLAAYDMELHEGRVGLAVEGGLQVEELTPQPLAPIRMDDDFERAPENAGVWETLSGHWASSGEVEERPKPSLSANPFSFHVQAEARALAVTGYDFWDSYRFRAAVKPAADGAVGLAACFQDTENYYLLRWSCSTPAGAPPAGRLQLMLVDGGQWRVLAERVDMPYQADMWYRLEIAVAGGCLEARVDDRLALTAMDDTFVRGRVALYADTCSDAYFDDVQIRSWDRYRETFAANPLPSRRCLPLRGRWSVEREHLYGAAQSPGGSAIATTGSPDWEDYTAHAAVKLKQAQRVGLIVCYQGPGNYYLVRWGTTPRGQGTRELVRVRDGKPQPLATAAFTCVRNRFEDIRVRVHRGHITVSADDRLVLEAADTTFGRGQIGFLVQGDSPACFDNVSVSFHRPPPKAPPITQQFTQEETMTSWASPQACWQQLDDGRYLYDLPLFTDYRVDVQLKALAQESGGLTLLLGTDDQLRGGARLRAQCADGALVAELAMGDRVLASGTATSAARSPQLVVERDGDAVIASLVDELGGATLLAHQVGGALVDTRLGFEGAGLSPGPGQIHVRSDGILDQTFSGAATDWRPGGGIWSVHDRWACFPGWSWFGGVDPEGDPKNPIVWCKDEWLGDIVLEFWSAVIMDLPAQPGYSDASDLNCTICADGRDLCSGYSFIYAGDHNKHAKMLRGNEVVGTNEKGVFVNPKSNNAAFHRHWFKTRVEKRGGHIEYFMDDDFLIAFDDPEPLSGGGIALWTYNNGMNIARVRISSQSRVRGAVAGYRLQ